MARRTFEEAATITDGAVEIIDEVLDIGDEAENAEETAIVVSGSQTLSRGLNAVSAQLERAASEEVDRQYPGLVGVERQAAVKVEAFRQTQGFELMAMAMRVKILRELQENRLLSAHPAQYGSLAQMATDNGMSVSELSFELDLVNIVLPYIQNELELPAHEFYNSIGRSKIKDMMTHLKELITGQQSNSPEARAAVERYIQEQYDGMREEVVQEIQEAMENTPEDRRAEVGAQVRATIMRRVRREAVRNLVEQAQNLPVREFRRHLQPNPTENVHFIKIMDGENVTLVASLTPEQLRMIEARFGTRVEVTPLELPEDPTTRQAEAFRVAPLRRLYERVYGGGR